MVEKTQPLHNKLLSGGEPIQDDYEEFVTLHVTSTVAPQPWTRRV